jgi:2-octaprenyl-6-methoxyphenol hydroxylase
MAGSAIPRHSDINMAPSASSIAIIGAGPAGLAAALMIAQRGKPVTIYGPRATAPDSRTTALLGPTVAALDEAGAWPLARPFAAPLRIMRIVDGTRRLWRAPPVSFDSAEMSLEAFGWNIANGRLTEALEQATRANALIERVEAPARVTAISDTHVEIATEGDAAPPRAFSLVIAADGRRSAARQAAGIEVRDWSYPQVAVTASFAHSRPHRDISTEFHTETGPFTLVPLPGQRSSLVCIVKPEEAERLAALDEASLALEIERRGHSILGKITLEPGRASIPMGGMTADRFAARRVALVGETAHVFPPIGAQGFNLTMRDGIAIADGVASAADPGGASVLEAYDRNRRGDVRLRTTAVDLLNRSLLSDMLAVQGVRGLGMFMLDRIGPLRRAMMREGLSARQ